MTENEPSVPDIPESEIGMSFSRSGGRGGQKVNKTSSKVTLYWYPVQSHALSQEQKNRLLSSRELAGFLNSEGAVVLQEERSRSQAENRVLALERLNNLVKRSLAVRRRRKRTRATRASIEKRLDRKRKRSITKKNRSRVEGG